MTTTNAAASLDADKILIIDDDEAFRLTLARALDRKGYVTLPAANISEALDLSSRHLPDYAIIDLKIERESGLDCLQPLQDINPGIRMLILTGYSSIATAVNAIKKGAVNYACKPLGVDEILGILVEGRETDAIPEEEPVSVDRLEWEHIHRVLDDNEGNISATARALGMHRRTLQRKLLKRPVRR